MPHASYHNHTSWSDGKASAAEMLAAAHRQGLPEVGLSDHYVLHPAGHEYRWSIAMGALGRYVAELRGLAADAPIPLRIGVELDWFPSLDDQLGIVLAQHDFDHVIGSVHEVDGMILDGSPAAWEKLSPAERDEVHRRYWHHVAEMAGSGLFDIAAHLDLSKKFGFLPTIDLTAEIDAALDVIADVDIVVELNTAGWHKPCDDGYPTLEILQGCRRRGIVVTLSADAHQPDHLVRDFDRGAERLRAAGYTEIARFAGRERHLVSL